MYVAETSLSDVMLMSVMLGSVGIGGQQVGGHACSSSKHVLLCTYAVLFLPFSMGCQWLPCRVTLAWSLLLHADSVNMEYSTDIFTGIFTPLTVSVLVVLHCRALSCT